MKIIHLSNIWFYRYAIRRNVLHCDLITNLDVIRTSIQKRNHTVFRKRNHTIEP